jgi:chromosome segregation ATPase
MNARTAELVNCNVHVSPALARRIRKASLAEENGQDARGALMVAADSNPDELERLQSRVEALSLALDDSEHSHALLKVKADQLALDLSNAQSKLDELKLAKEHIASLDETLARSVDMRSLPKKIVEKFRAAVDEIRSGDDPQSAFLTAAGYERNTVDEAMSAIGPLRSSLAEMEVTVAPLREVLSSRGMKAWIVRRILGLA